MSERNIWSSFRAVEFTISASLLAILASAGAPVPGTDLIARNQRAAVETLLTIAEVQARFRSLDAIDTDCDGKGEYGYFAELAGTRPMRVSNNCVPGAGTPADILNPPLLPNVFGQVGVSVVRHKGYYFQMWLPNATAAGQVPGIGEAYTGGTSGTFPNPNNGERVWNCYAWPVDYGRTGNWAFFINQLGLVFKYPNGTITPYNGMIMRPSFDEAYRRAGDMGSPIRIGEAGGANNTIWTLVEPSAWEWIPENQQAVVAALRSIASAQEALRSAAEIDTNCDGVGEYGYLAELAGTKPMRSYFGEPPDTRPMRVIDACVPIAGSQADILSPPLIESSLGMVQVHCVEYCGYVFMMWLPRATADGKVRPINEESWGGKSEAPFPDPNNGSALWCCYAWPVHYGQTGRRVYMVNQRGIVLEYQNRSDSPYEGSWATWASYTPNPMEAYTDTEDMSSPLRVGVPGGFRNTIWTPVGP